ncbi:MAG: hypothetical protein BAJALOKI3v1_180051 [Promethearchaeota archaeon]|nr:MAG: hypothetical protein BAJALOKI3v1_180051 [Candidatus Lokiarchaeota archaeon]
MRAQKFPKMRFVTQAIRFPEVENLESLITNKLKDFGLNKRVSNGERIALTASSRGIKSQALILRLLVDYLKTLGTKPYIIPAMGSHGGATAKGQMEILKEYGITTQSMGCPIRATMEVVKLGVTEFGTPLVVNKHVLDADKIFIINKINTHSKFVGPVESGLSKMCLIGLGSHQGAKLYHRLIEKYSWTTVIQSLSNLIIEKLPIMAGLAIIQNAYNKVSEIHFLKPEEFVEKEPELLERCKEIKPKIPFNELDLLIIDEMGKNIFGTGMDTQITGKKRNSEMNVQWVFVRDLTEETHGNAQGIGLADFTTKRLVDKIDFSQTYENALTAYRTDSPKIPIFLPTDKDILNKIFDVSGIKNPSEFRIVWIKNTLELGKMLVSEAFFDEIESKINLNSVEGVEDIQFDKQGYLTNSKKYW